MKALLISKDRDDPYIQQAAAYIRNHFDDSLVILAKTGEKTIPEAVSDWEGDYIISYLCPWVLPAPVLQKARCAAINFHPATPDYPGTGCTNFAIYDEVEQYGAMCHHMACGVDSGEVIAVRYFPVTREDSVYSLTWRCYQVMYQLFIEIMETCVLPNRPFPVSPHQWTRRPYRRVELNRLKQLNFEMSAEEISRRVRATTYPGTPGAYFEVNGLKFEYQPKNNVK